MIITPLTPHQKGGLDYLKGRKVCALFWPKGSGKSLAALAYAEEIGARRVLITSDKNNTLNTWPDEVWKHTDYEVVIRPKSQCFVGLDWHVKSERPGRFEKGAGPVVCVLVNYDKLSRDWVLYQGVNWDLWIGDESLDFKDPRTIRYRRLSLVVNRIPHRLILNGVPMTERLEDFFGQFRILDGGKALGWSITVFRSRFMQLSRDGYRWEPKRSAFTHVQNAIKDISHWLDDEEIKMPETRYIKAEVNLTPEQQELDDGFKTEFAANFKGDKIELKHAAAVFVKRAQLAGGIFHGEKKQVVSCNKIGVVKRLIENNPEAKIVVWHEYIAETQLLQDTLRGETVLTYTDPNNSEALTRFQNTTTGGILLIRNSMCKGLNQLADADIAVFYSNPFSYSKRSQAEGRSRRMTSTTSVTHVVDIVTRTGADQHIYSMLDRKRSVSMTVQGMRKLLDEHNTV